MCKLVEPLDLVAVGRADEMLRDWYEPLDGVRFSATEIIVALSDLLGSWELATLVWDCQDSVGADGDVLASLFVLWDCGDLQLSTAVYDQINRSVSPNSQTSWMLGSVELS